MINRQRQERSEVCASAAAVAVQRSDDSSSDRRGTQRPGAGDPREWRWGDGLRPEPGEDVVFTDADRRRWRREDRLERAFNVAVVVVVAVVVLLVCGWVGLWLYFGLTGQYGYCCGPE